MNLLTIAGLTKLSIHGLLSANAGKDKGFSHLLLFLGMIRIALFCVLYCCPVLAFCQLEDDFSDGNLTANPAWQGDLDSFTVNASLEMQLMATASGQSSIFAPLNIPDSVVWAFYLRMDFAPSGTNRLKIYLQADDANLPSASGYYLEVGESGSEDALRLYRQDAATASLLATASSGTMGTEPAVARLQISRSGQGVWRLAADYSGGQQLVEEFVVTDNTYGSGASFFGFECHYSSTRKDKFFFDDIAIRLLLPDTEAPVLLEATAISANQLDVSFDETLQAAAAEQVSNYFVDGGIGSPSTAMLDAADPSLVHLGFALNFASGQPYQITASNMTDVHNNVAADQIFDFTYYLLEAAAPFDILINEILADPTPLVGLPDAEYVELYNRSSKVIDLAELQFGKTGGSPQSLPNGLLLPGEYIILTDDSKAALLASFGRVISLNSMPALTNTGDELILSTTGGMVIHEVNYTDDWYQDADKADGGWSLELINPGLYCIGDANWIASNDVQGGTPGSQNTVFDDEPDSEGPHLLQAIPLNDRQIRLFFDEILSDNVEDITIYNIGPGLGAVISAELELPDLSSVLLEIEAPFFEDAASYTIGLTDQLTDCSGNSIEGSKTLNFEYYDMRFAAPFDVLITEIMADPVLDGGGTLGLPAVEYVELHNRSDQVLNLENYILSDRSGEVLLPYYLLFPGSYVLLYEAGSPSFQTLSDSLPLAGFIGLGNESDDLELRSQDGTLLHSVYYTDNWYRDSGKKNGGWSLELIDTAQPCLGMANWRACEKLSGGTPAAANSVATELVVTPGPQLLRVFPTTENQLRLTFDRALDIQTAEGLTHYQLEGFSIVDASVETPFFTSVLLQLNPAFEAGQIYELHVQNSLPDCTGQLADTEQTASFGLAEDVMPNDLVINEILFNPETGGARFVELYNRSDKAVNAAALVLARRNELGEVDQVKPVLENYLVLPGSYLVLSPDPGDILSRYTVENPGAMLTNAVPTYGDKEGTVLVYRSVLNDVLLIDELQYTRDFHNSLLDDEDGVSLERIDPDGPTQVESNWHSAAQAAGFATPTYQNSQYAKSSPSGEMVSLANTTLSPDGDGLEDFLLIQYQLPQAGFFANVQIYDAAGRLIRKVASNELLAQQGNFKWDGTMANGGKARMGIYVVWVELFSVDGKTQTFKETIVLAGQLE